MTTEKNVYLTETILSIHNEVQSALDYISSIATERGTDLGKSTAILSIQNLRIKVPIKFSLEITEQLAETTSNTSKAEKMVETDKLLARRGLVLQTDELDKTSVLTSKIGVNLLSTEKQTSNSTENSVEHKQDAWGEIEITFTPLKRVQ
jgi:uncharacterized protein YqfA (UPF0365 family)